MRFRMYALTLAISVFLTTAGPVVRAQEKPDLDQALQFFRNGGAWSSRLVPDEQADKQTQWTILVLTGPKVQYDSSLGGFQLPGVFKSIEDAQAPLKVASVFADPQDRATFIKRFAGSLEKSEVQAYLVVTPPLGKDAKVPMRNASRITAKVLLELFSASKAK